MPGPVAAVAASGLSWASSARVRAAAVPQEERAGVLHLAGEDLGRGAGVVGGDVQAPVPQVVVAPEVRGEPAGVDGRRHRGEVQPVLGGDALRDQPGLDAVPRLDDAQLLAAGGRAEEERDEVFAQGARGAGVVELHLLARAVAGAVPDDPQYVPAADAGQVVVDRDRAGGRREERLHGLAPRGPVQAGDEDDAHCGLLSENENRFH